ncbi:MAG: DNA-processing protein DprA [Rikenellaceae bacterium]
MKIHDIALSIALKEPNVISHLVETFGNAENVLNASDDELLEEAQLSEKMLLKFSNKKGIMERAEQELEFCSKFKINILTKYDGNYPENLEECYDSPLVLYSKGNIDFNKSPEKWLAVVGTRKNTAVGEYYCTKLVSELAEKHPDVVIVSGLAYGIDSIAHRAALNYGLKTVAYVAHGLNTIYPSQHRDLAKEIIESGGAIVTEYPQGMKPYPNNFLSRNRLVAGTSAATIVVETPYKGGAISTANITDSYSRELFAMVGRTTDASFTGCNKLIKSCKANMLEDVKDLEYVMGWNETKPDMCPAQSSLSLSSEEQVVYDCFVAGEEITVDEIVEKTGLSAPECLLLLTTLELNDIIKQVKGMLYVKLK